MAQKSIKLEDVKQTISDKDGTWVHTTTLARVFSVTERRIQQLTSDGTITPVIWRVNGKDQRRFEFTTTVRDYVKHLQDKLARRDETQGALSFDKERAEHEHTRNMIDKIRLGILQGKIFEADNIEMFVTDMLIKFKSKLDAIPSQIAPKLEGQPKEEIESLLNIEVRKALEELAEFNPEDYRSEEFVDVSDEEAMAVMENGQEDK